MPEQCMTLKRCFSIHDFMHLLFPTVIVTITRICLYVCMSVCVVKYSNSYQWLQLAVCLTHCVPSYASV